ncbi:MAG: hypothetical protein CFE23_09710 [Flavobacterium sp. BFFFF1]|uniref:GIN domain-containing protein n=1 Tax=Flavobacterium sp. BFFFF1 TaxID=2015557 RepID=UPI000BD665EE|nr:DUF2807 domain-containing protein [Flavobacterium sp. BFFFF1]OYU80332.1 MAG: hypothetical protein CFE23_09710 [Flavobacterium sp. BFFFF1]
MLKFTTTIILFLIGVLTQAQVTENRTIAAFSKIEVQNGITLVHALAANHSAKVIINDSESLSNIATETKNGVLKIYTVDNNPVKDVTVYVNINNVTGLTASGKSLISLPQAVETRNMDIVLSSGSKFTGLLRSKMRTTLKVSDNAVFDGRVETTRLSAYFTDNAKVNLSGTADDAYVSTANNALLLARNLETKYATVFSSDWSAVTIYSGHNMMINVSDLAKVTYTGEPKNVRLNEEALATVRKTDSLLANE